MNHLLACALAVLSSAVVAAQDPAPAPIQAPGAAPDALAASKAKAAAALAKTASLAGAEFTATWAAAADQPADANVFPWSGSGEGAVAGSFAQGLSTCRFEGDNGDELVAAGGRMIAKDGNTGWVLRKNRFADGNTIDFVPDVAQLLEHLAACDLTAVHREVGSLDDRPVETVTIALTPEQIQEALYAGILPPALAGNGAGFPGVIFQLAAGGKGGARPAPQAPDATIDLAIAFDPATGLVQRLQFRSWTKQANARVLRGGAGVIAVQAVGGVRLGRAGKQEPEEEVADESESSTDAKAGATKADAPLQYENGLPVRSRKQMTVVDYTVRLREHGAARAPALTDLQKKLLRL